MMIEGGSRWGYDPIWNKKDPPEEKHQQNEDQPERLDKSNASLESV
jgi:hypothetical protein